MRALRWAEWGALEPCSVPAECASAPTPLRGTRVHHRRSGAPHPAPQKSERQRQFYSGKQKRHSIKNNLIIERRTRKIKGLSTTCEGKKHDKRLADEQALRFPKGSKLWKDTGFQGYEPAGVTTLQPKKKPKGGKLSPAEQEAKRRVSTEKLRAGSRDYLR